MLNNIDFNKLRSFYWVYQKQSLLEASEYLHVTPSAVSQAIQGLEKSLGMSLFARSGKKYLPTRRAKTIYPIVAKFISELSQEFEESNKNSAEFNETLHIGCVPEFGRNQLVGALHKFSLKHHKMKFSVTLADTNQLINRVLSTELDFVICDDGPYQREHNQLSFKPIYQEELVLACSSPYYQSHIREDHSFKLLSTLNHIPYHEGQEATYKWFQHHFGKVPSLNSTLSIDGAASVATAITKGFGLGVVPTYMIQSEIQNRKVRIIETKKSPLINQIIVLQLKDKIESRAEKSLLSLLQTDLAYKN